MKIELIWLAYDPKLLQRAWSRVTIRQLYLELLHDEFRKRVDPRSLLFHKAQFYLLNDLELLMKRGGNDLTLEEYLARLFHKGVEEFPIAAGELAFDYRLICYYTTLRMADDHHFVEPYFKALLRRVGRLQPDARWSLLELSDPRSFFESLTQLSIQTVIEVAHEMSRESEEAATQTKAFVKLVTNYIEFHNFAQNNRQAIFYYNDQTDIRRWGTLMERKALRDQQVVELTYSKSARDRVQSLIERHSMHVDDDLISKMRFKRRIENLEAGLQDRDPLIRQKAAEALGISGNLHSVVPLIEALSDEAAEVRQDAARALGLIGDPRSADAIIQLVLKDESVAVIMSGAQALVQIGVPSGLEALVELLLRGIYDIAVQIAVFPGLMKHRAAVNMLLQALHHPNEMVRRQVAFILGDVPNKTAVDALIGSLADSDPEVQTNSASSLGRIGSRRALPELYQCRNSLEAQHARWVVEEAIDTILEKGGAGGAAAG